nr:aspartate carbamoyltransferase [uncultured Campylobacter sp.]
MQDTKEIKIAGRYEFRGLKIINIYELEDLSIFYATTKSLNSCDKKAIIEFYGLRQYHKPAPPLDLIAELLDAINNVSSIDLCYDSHTPFNLDAFKIIKYGSTAYVKAEFGTLQRIYFYDKALKNDLSFSLYRAEATAPIIDLNKPALLPKTERLELQLHQAVSDFKDILKLATSSPNNR